MEKKYFVLNEPYRTAADIRELGATSLTWGGCNGDFNQSGAEKPAFRSGNGAL